MISYDFAYFKPKTIDEAVKQFSHVRQLGKQPVYYSGGTELISRARKNELQIDALIDLKAIPDCLEVHQQDGKQIIGSCVPLNQLTEEGDFPLLSDVVRKIATHTARNKITIGGNLMSALPYREALLPFLLTESTVHVAGESGVREIPVSDLTSDQATIGADEFIVHIETDRAMLTLPHKHVRKTKQSSLNYPIVSLASIVHDGTIRIACSGLCAQPFRNHELETRLNDHAESIYRRIVAALQSIQAPVIHDLQASIEYRTFLFEQALQDIIQYMEEVAT